MTKKFMLTLAAILTLSAISQADACARHFRGGRGWGWGVPAYTVGFASGLVGSTVGGFFGGGYYPYGYYAPYGWYY